MAQFLLHATKSDDPALVLEQLERAVRSLESSSSSSDSVTYGSLLRRCGSARALSHGRRIHAQMIKHGRLRGDEFLSNLVLQMYGKCSIEDASEFFHRMDPRNQFSWNIMLSILSQSGHLDRAEKFFSGMPRRDVASWTAMLVAYAKSNRIDRAKLLFDQMPERNTVSWNAMICAFAREGDFARALGLFRAMDLEGARPDRVTFVAILDACGQSLAMELGMWIHAELLAAGFQGEITISTALVEMYGRLGKIEDARRAFDRATGIDGAGGDAVLWAAMLAAYAINHSPSQAREFFENTPPRLRSSVSWTTMVTAYARAGDLHAARQLFDKIPRKNNNVVAWNSIITAYAQSGHRRREALDLFRAMDLEGIAPDSVTFTAIIDSCSSVAEGRIVHSILTDEGRGWIAHFAIQTALVAMYGNFGHLREAKLVFDDLKHRDVKAWSSMLAAFALNGHSHEALEIFHAMQLHGFTPNSVTFVSVLLACAHAGLLSDVYSHFASLSADYAIAASLDHYMCVVDALARSGRLREAEDLIATMPFEPDAVAWTSLLSASTAAGDSHRAGKAAEYVYELDPTNAAPYTLLSGLQLGPARNAASSSSSSSSYSSSRLSDHVTKTEDDSSCLSTLNFCQF